MSASVESKFDALGLDYRVLRGIEKKEISVPTQVQAAVIPAALEGKDITAQAHTGTGKTLAYLAPAVHRLLQSGDSNPEFSVVVLVPTSELCEQVLLIPCVLTQWKFSGRCVYQIRHMVSRSYLWHKTKGFSCR